MFKVGEEKAKSIVERLNKADEEGVLLTVLKSAISFERSSFLTVVDIINQLRVGKECHLDESIIYLMEEGLTSWEKNEENMKDEVSVKIVGFNTIEEARVFCDWYGGEGEQSSSVWFDCRASEGEIETGCMLCESVRNIDSKNLEMTLKMYKSMVIS